MTLCCIIQLHSTTLLKKAESISLYMYTYLANKAYPDSEESEPLLNSSKELPVKNFSPVTS